MSAALSEPAHPGSARLSLAARPAHPQLHRAVTRLLEGAHPWGWTQLSITGRGWSTIRLVVFPPGTDARERRALNFERNWPIAGAAAALLAMITLGEVVAPAVLVPVLVVGYVGGILLARHATRGVRSRVLRVSATQCIDDEADRDTGGAARCADFDRIARTVATLRALDRAAAASAIDAVEYERAWTLVYRAMERAAVRRARVR